MVLKPYILLRQKPYILLRLTKNVENDIVDLWQKKNLSPLDKHTIIFDIYNKTSFGEGSFEVGNLICNLSPAWRPGTPTFKELFDPNDQK